MKAKLLIVEDDPSNADVFFDFLDAIHEETEFQSVDVVVERSANATFQRDDLETFDLAILDIRLESGFDGFELHRFLRTKNSEIETVFVTGTLTRLTDFVSEAIELGAFFFLQKPIVRAAFRGIVLRCLEKILARRRIDEEFRIARTFFDRLSLPSKTFPVVNGITAAAFCEPYGNVGGDLADVVSVSPGLGVCLLCDMEGHSLRSGLFVGLVAATFRQACTRMLSPLDVVAEIRSALSSLRMNVGATLFCAAINPIHGTLRYVSAGHSDAFVVHRRGVRSLEPTGDMIHDGLELREWDCNEIVLDEADQLIVLSDGIRDSLRIAHDKIQADDMVSRTIQNLSQLTNSDPGSTIEFIRERLLFPASSDDRTVLVCRRVGEPPEV